MKVVPFTGKYIEDAAKIVLEAYKVERNSVEILPWHEDYLQIMMQDMSSLPGSEAGVAGFAALEGGKLLGFIAGGYPVERFFSSHKGVYVPLTCHGAAGQHRRLVYQRLYEAVSGAWVREGRLTHCLSMFAHDAEAVDAWYWLGFGLRCVDAIRPLTDVEDANRESGLKIRKAGPEDAETLYPLHLEHCGYYRNAPLFMPSVDVEDGLEELRKWLMGKDQHLWVAYADDTPVSYMRIHRGGESFVSDDPLMYNINAAYTTNATRGTGAGAQLLSAIVEWVREQGCVRLGVDYESFNIYGSRFWLRHFTPFMFSPVRSIDDRVIGGGI